MRSVEQALPITALHERAASWFENNQMIENAIDHVLLAQNNARAASLIVHNAHQLLSDGKMMRIQQWLTQLPSELVLAYPAIYLLQGLILFRIGHIEALAVHLEIYPTELTAPQRGELFTLQAHVAFVRGEFTQALKLVQDACTWLDQENLALRMPTMTLSAWCYEAMGDFAAALTAHKNTRQMAQTAGSLTGMIGSLSKLCMLYAKIGRNQLATTYFEQAIQFAKQNNALHMPLLGMAFIGNGQLRQDCELLIKGITICKQWGGLHIEAMRGYGVLLVILRQQGNRTAIGKTVQEAQQFAVANQLADWVLTLLESAEASTLFEPLTEREQDVLGWMVKGLSVPKISAELVISPSTIRTHIKRIYAKLNAHSRHEALQNARQYKLIS